MKLKCRQTAHPFVSNSKFELEKRWLHDYRENIKVSVLSGDLVAWASDSFCAPREKDVACRFPARVLACSWANASLIKYNQIYNVSVSK